MRNLNCELHVETLARNWNFKMEALVYNSDYKGGTLSWNSKEEWSTRNKNPKTGLYNCKLEILIRNSSCKSQVDTLIWNSDSKLKILA